MGCYIIKIFNFYIVTSIMNSTEMKTCINMARKDVKNKSIPR